MSIIKLDEINRRITLIVQLFSNLMRNYELNNSPFGYKAIKLNSQITNREQFKFLLSFFEELCAKYTEITNKINRLSQYTTDFYHILWFLPYGQLNNSQEIIKTLCLP